MINTLKAQLHEETTGRQLAEQKVASLQSQLADNHFCKAGYDKKTTELQAEVEADLRVEKLKKQKWELQETRSRAYAHEAQSQQVQVTELPAEVAALKSHLEAYLEQDLGGKNEQRALELRQQR